MRIKVTTENNGKHFAVGVPVIIDSDGEVSITLTQAAGAAEMLRSEAFPIKSFCVPSRRRYKTKKVA